MEIINVEVTKSLHSLEWKQVIRIFRPIVIGILLQAI